MSLVSLPLVLDLVAKASLVLAMTALVAAALRRASASARHFVWTLGLLAALAAPALTAALPRWELPLVTIAPAAARGVAPAADAPTAVAAARTAPALGRARTESATDSKATSPARSLPSWPAPALFVWIAGAAVVLSRMLLGLAAVAWMSRRTPVVNDAAWLPEARDLAGDLGLRHVRFLRGGKGSMPMAWGIFHSSVVMPADADAWPHDRIRVVLLHELAHVKRRDCLTHMVAQIACAAYWFNPLAWMAARRLRSERERACDDLVLAAGTRGSDYADQLLDIARVMTAGRFPAVLAGASLAMAKRSQLEGRLIAILDPGVARSGLSRARAAAAAALFAVVMLAVASVQPWAEERVSGNGVTAEAAPAATALPQSLAERPIETYPGQANRDVRTNAAQQGVIQGAIQDAVQGVVQGQLQGQVQGQVQGAIQGQLQGAIQGGIKGGVRGGIAGGVPGGMPGGIAGGVVGGVISVVGDAVVSGIADGVADAAREVAAQVKDVQNERVSEKGRVRDPRTVNALLEALKDTDKDVRETAMNVLAQMRDPRIFEPLVAALKDASPDVREHAAFGLGQMRDVRAIEPLAAAIKDSNASVREQVVFALGQLRAAGAIDALTTALHDSSADVREQAAFALGQIRDRRSVEALISALKDTAPDVRQQSAFALGQMRDAKAIEALVVALKDSAPDVREQAAFALGQIGDPRAIDGLTAALKDQSASVRQQAAFALGQIR